MTPVLYPIQVGRPRASPARGLGARVGEGAPARPAWNIDGELARGIEAGVDGAAPADPAWTLEDGLALRACVDPAGAGEVRPSVLLCRAA